MAMTIAVLAGAQDNKPPAKWAVVVNSANKCTDTGDAAKATIKKLFLKELTQWPGGLEAKPYSRDGLAPEQVAFLKLVLGMSEAELARHWMKMKNMSGTTPPKDVDTERMLLKYVAKTAGAFGVVRIDAAKGVEGVRVLFEF
jgi:hypothetical protein